ncbi:MAG: zinc ribbon domain-containing protein [Pontiellaceae bacterium]|nr:zinc ribbon domain-containing protein [Pontiellaceae bacterium]MBN2785087.1 zinc ribbon domain-containing protein [Pontiellaceae bacterium]
MKKIILAVFILLLAGIAVFWIMMPKGPFCQSCAMPMENAALFGTETDGSPSADYCCYCYQYGAFTAPDITMEEMLEKSILPMVQNTHMPEERAHRIMEKTLPRLKRWRSE